MPNPIHETIASSSDPIGTVLGTGARNSSRQVRDHLTTKTSDAGDGQTLTRTHGMGRATSGQVSITNRTQSSTPPVLSVTGQGLTLTGTTAGEAGDGEGDGHRSVVVVRVL